MASLDDINAGEAQEKFKNNAPQAASLYAERAAAASSKWQDRAASSQDAYEQAMRDQATLQRRLDNITGDAASKYEENINQYGSSRFQEGVRNSGNRYRDGFAPIADALSGLSITDRGPKMSEANFERVREVAEAAFNASNNTR